MAGELRQVAHASRRLAEAARLGFTRAIVPANSANGVDGISLIRVSTLTEALVAVGLHGVPLQVEFLHDDAGPPTDALHEALAVVAPGTPLRDGIERIVRAKMGALLILGDGPDVLAICSGGFLLDAPFSPQRLSELAKMDGAIILGSHGQRLARANVHLVPDPSVPTTETGTRHRTAERVARSIPVPVVSVSEEMGVISVYAGGMRHQLQDISRLLDRANQALQTLERYKVRLDDTLASLTALELEDVATIRDVASVVQRGEMVRRISAEIETMIVELGVDARLLRLQVDEVNGETNHELELVLADYPRIANNWAGHGLEGDSPALPARLAVADPGTTHHASARQRDRRPLRRPRQVATGDDRRDRRGRRHRQLARDVAVKETLDRITETSILDQYA